MADDRRVGLRVNLTLPEEVCRVLDRMTKVTGAGRATLIREFLVDGLPQFDHIATAMEMASKRNLDALKILGDTLSDLSQQTDQLSLQIKAKRRAAMRKRNRD